MGVANTTVDLGLEKKLREIIRKSESWNDELRPKPPVKRRGFQEPERRSSISEETTNSDEKRAFARHRKGRQGSTITKVFELTCIRDAQE